MILGLPGQAQLLTPVPCCVLNQQNDFYPIVGPGPFWKRFRVNFCEFTELLVQQTHSSVLCDGHLMDTVICMLSGLTNSAVHSLRHTSSLAGGPLHRAARPGSR